MIYAVIDTNVFVSALLTSQQESATVKVFHMMFDGKIRLIYNEEIIAEYAEVLARKKFNFDPNLIKTLLIYIEKYGEYVDRKACGIELVDKKDLPFYEVYITKKELNTYLITGNKKHFPNEESIVSPKEFIDLNLA